MKYYVYLKQNCRWRADVCQLPGGVFKSCPMSCDQTANLIICAWMSWNLWSWVQIHVHKMLVMPQHCWILEFNWSEGVYYLTIQMIKNVGLFLRGKTLNLHLFGGAYIHHWISLPCQWGLMAYIKLDTQRIRNQLFFLGIFAIIKKKLGIKKKKNMDSKSACAQI